MWPHKVGLGVRLSYGVDGNGILSIKSNNENNNNINDDDNNDNNDCNEIEPIMDFPRLEPNTPNQYYKSNSKKLLRNPLNYSTIDDQILTTSSKDTRSLLTPNYIPHQILSSYGLESSAIESDFAYDPIFGDIIKAFTITNSTKEYNGLSYVTGSSLTVLNFAIFFKGSSSASLKLSEPYEVDFLDNIRQVDIKSDNKQLVILVRTNTKIYVLTCRLISDSKDSKASPNFDMSIIKEIISSKFGNSTFADVSICFKDIRKFAIVDILGNLAVWKINKNFTKVHKLNKDNLKMPIVSSQDLSNWMKINWLTNSGKSKSKTTDQLLLSTRIKTFQCDMTNNTQTSLMTSNTWSRLRDVYILGENVFYLTSKEIIWFKYESQNSNISFERLLSWKHFLNDDDPSLKFSIFEIGKAFSIMIYSEISPTIIVYTFGFQIEKPFSLQDPYIIQGPARGLKQLVTIKDDIQNVHLLELSSNLTLSGSILQYGTPAGITTSPFHHTTKTLAKAATNIDKSKSTKLKKLYQNLIKFQGSDLSSIEILQNYASTLSSKFENESYFEKITSESYKSMLEIDNRIPLNISDIYELDDMIVELKNSTYMENIDIKSLINNGIIQRNGFLNITETQSHIYNIYLLIKDLFKEQNIPNSTINTAIILGLSLIKFENKSNNIHQQNFDEIKSNSSEKVQLLLDGWDEKEEEPESQQPDLKTVTSQFNTLPTLKSSQSQFTQPLASQSNHSQRLKRHASNLSQPSRNSQFSQSSSQQAKRKKKKVKGFG
ncbi:hypothetical protein KGF54_001616 [Candida jiufengensis]|uniref:uncharacterized protein n=1 Tax=Candida jiufengensis TaxID=497108 RepID=UPI0022240D7A|nr:uncharacterized protein KGF54_001616 [Candida jiufengensis]KAI5955055.1 hypothetical protein KGF54_001616 [Candida jiufengensis]